MLPMPGKKRNYSAVTAAGALDGGDDDFDENEIREELLSMLKHGMLLSELHTRILDKFNNVTEDQILDLLIDMDDVVTYTVPPRRCGTVSSNTETVYKLANIEEQQQNETGRLIEPIPTNTPYGELLQRISERFKKIKE